jgi:hypothetical protein
MNQENKESSEQPIQQKITESNIAFKDFKKSISNDEFLAVLNMAKVLPVPVHHSRHKNLCFKLSLTALDCIRFSYLLLYWLFLIWLKKNMKD